METLFLSKNCEMCTRIAKIINKKELHDLRASMTVVYDQSPDGSTAFRRNQVYVVPTLLIGRQERKEGPAVMAWLRQRIQDMKLNEESTLDIHHSQFHSGNKRFIFAVALLYYFVKTGCSV